MKKDIVLEDRTALLGQNRGQVQLAILNDVERLKLKVCPVVKVNGCKWKVQSSSTYM